MSPYFAFFATVLSISAMKCLEKRAFSPYCDPMGKEHLWERKILWLVLDVAKYEQVKVVLSVLIKYCICFHSASALQGCIAYI